MSFSVVYTIKFANIYAAHMQRNITKERARDSKDFFEVRIEIKK